MTFSSASRETQSAVTFEPNLAAATRDCYSREPIAHCFALLSAARHCDRPSIAITPSNPTLERPNATNSTSITPNSLARARYRGRTADHMNTFDTFATTTLVASLESRIHPVDSRGPGTGPACS
eukprot:Lithocolla_globosa_v1_NODE_2264_length_2081_cov_3807.677690.p3 type:complete len:124 gc:universal NODE_2264_length_2081_cov_3807.677690:416-45(-)